MELRYQAPGLRCQLGPTLGSLRVWRWDPTSVLRSELGLGLWQLAPLPDALAQRLERAALEAAVFHLPAVIGTPWPGATTRTLTATDGERSHTTIMHVRSGLPELLHHLEAAIWDACAELSRGRIASLTADAVTAPALAAGAPLEVGVRLFRRGDGLTFSPQPAAQLELTQGSRTVLRAPVTLEDDTPAAHSPNLWRRYRASPAPAAPPPGNYEVRVLVTGELEFPDAEKAEAAISAAPALLLVK